ncbi:hypothetical protein PV721_36000 [Streptomyces sp. MB09-01]|uniref:hypothetical protein n=1 Tax=Streptomyces sp. MB09-01 TaxID=3028666 RepID=UPI0029A31652|nr:hypothetical protein [Streptomyces sp. MB09-01]MDX3539639.1 hypothetical protein [Streptomyces sp. MB09-01]
MPGAARHLLIAACGFGDIDQGLGEEPAFEPGLQEDERLGSLAVAGQQARDEVHDQGVPRLRVRTAQRDRFVGPPPDLQQFGPGPGGRPPARRDVRGKHVQRGLVLLPLAEQPRAEPLPAPGPELHLRLMAELQKPGDQRRRNEARQGPGTRFKISSVHGPAP